MDETKEVRREIDRTKEERSKSMDVCLSLPLSRTQMKRGMFYAENLV